MSAGRKVEWAEAYAAAAPIAERLAGVSARCKAVGSLRRRRPTVGDLEFLVEPELEENLFGDVRPLIEPIRRACLDLGEILKGGDRYIQFRRLLERGGSLKVDVYLCHPPAEWGSLLAIRTGPADLGAAAMAALNRRGYSHRQGGIYRGSEKIAVPDEETFFRLAGLPCLPPARRDEPEARRALEGAGA